MMDAVSHILPQDWMHAPETAAVMAALADDGATGPAALFVGGCVRNALLGRAVDDVDIATRRTPDAVTSCLEKAGLKAVPTGIAHGTVTAVSGGKTFEITTLRRDVRTDGRRAVVAFTADWAEDAARRDFTMNTLLADAAGHVYDPLGTGLADLKAGRVVFVGDPAARIAEDYLRILRFFRFHSYYGQGKPDNAALAACRAEAARIETLSRERITQELLKILMTDDPVAALDTMFGCGVLAALPGPSYVPAALGRLAALQVRESLPDAATRLALLDIPAVVRERVLILPNKTLKTLNILAAAQGDARADAKHLIYRLGPEHAAQILLCRAARDDTPADLSLVRTWTPPRFPLSGDDLLKAGVPAGPALGALLERLEEWWITEDFTPDRPACLARLSALLSGS